MTLSKCNFGKGFTCNSGHCLDDIDKRCDEQMDCNDYSDEDHCTLVELPLLYIKSNPPKLSGQNKTSLDIHTEIELINIDSIDTVNMAVTLTLKISMKWHDSRLTFSNPRINQTNPVLTETSQLLWLPFDNLVYENAIIGEIKLDSGTKVDMYASNPRDIDSEMAVEDRVFDGSNNALKAIRRMKISYNCIFSVRKFPFDKQKCYFEMRISHRKYTDINFVEIGPVIYHGASDVKQFAIGKIEETINNTGKNARFIFTIPMVRNVGNKLLTTFIPTFVLWLFGYSTLFIAVEHSSDRFIGAGTALLVIVTLINAISDELPKTSYPKQIDIWFVWHLISIFFIIVYHIILDRLLQHFREDLDNVVRSFENNDETEGSKSKLNKINGMAIILFPALNEIFYGIYFYHTQF